MKQFLAILCGLLCLSALAAEVIPPAPTQYFNDYAGVVSSGTVSQLNQQLEQFEKDSSCQIVVAVYPTMQSDSSIDDYTRRVAQSWGVGQKDKKNGAVLFVFTQDHRMFIQTGYGLEGAMPDIICKRIVDNEIKPRFKAGDYDGGLTAGVNAMLAAAKGEYKGNGQTVGNHGASQGVPIIFIIIFIVIFAIIAMSNARRGGYYSSGGWFVGGWGGGGGGGWSGGGGGGGGGGGFSGGGGSFGGGGAGGSW